MMLPSLPELKVYLAVGTTDMRKSINGLSILVADHMELDPFTGHLFAFCNRKRDIVKILYWDRNGFCLWHKRLEKDRFSWPESPAEVLDLSVRQLNWLLDGLSLEQNSAHQRLNYTAVI
jgi:transposase